MATYVRFEDLPVWQLAREFRAVIRKLSKETSLTKDFSLKDQITRSSRSIQANISEGFEKGTNKEFIRYLYISKASCGETRNHLYETFDEGYIDETTFKEICMRCENVSAQLSKFIGYLEQSELKKRTGSISSKVIEQHIT